MLTGWMQKSTALRRLMTEHKELTRCPPDGIAASPIADDNYYRWEAAIV